jgi:DUF3019 family protein
LKWRFLVSLLAAAAPLLLPAPAVAADPPVRLVVKPLLCVLDKGATSCSMTFDVRWRSEAASEFCLHDGAQPTPLRCWASARAGDLQQARAVSEDFVYWLTHPTGVERLAEVKISVLRVDSADRRRERRARHVWDVL